MMSVARALLGRRGRRLVTNSLFDDFISPAIKDIEKLNELVGGLIASVGKIALNDGALPLLVTVGS